MSDRERRFVILEHEIGSGFERSSSNHLDWMFEQEADLRTFATPVFALTDPSGRFISPLSLVVAELPPHRFHYLDYEGPISGDRGQVRRLAAGTFQALEDNDASFRARLWFRVCHRSEEPRFNKQMLDATVWFQRTVDADSGVLRDNRDGWRLRFAPG